MIEFLLLLMQKYKKKYPDWIHYCQELDFEVVLYSKYNTLEGEVLSGEDQGMLNTLYDLYGHLGLPKSRGKL